MRVMKKLIVESNGEVRFTTSFSLNEQNATEYPSTGWMFIGGNGRHPRLANVNGMMVTPKASGHTRFARLLTDPKLAIKDGLILNELVFIADSGLDVVTKQSEELSLIKKGKEISKGSMNGYGHVVDMVTGTSAIYLGGGTIKRGQITGFGEWYYRYLYERSSITFEARITSSDGHFLYDPRTKYLESWRQTNYPVSVSEPQSYNIATARHVMETNWFIPNSRFGKVDTITIPITSIHDFDKAVADYNIKGIGKNSASTQFEYRYLAKTAIEVDGELEIHQITLSDGYTYNTLGKR